MLLVGWKEGHLTCKIIEWWGAGMIVWSEVQICIWPPLIPLSLIVSCFSKIQIVFAFLVPADPGSPGQRAVKRVL